ncbi:MAG: beta-ketoacyl synthase N-terminal-like domain-containing protein [Candidatus Aminicenantes bacterium]|jgi:acyl transferase domain-containing protein
MTGEIKNLTGLEIAVIGMAGRFPGAKNLEEFRLNLENGIESIPFFSDRELIDSGVNPTQVEHPDYVKSCGSMLEDKEYFDAVFFGYKPTEAEVMDPQTRIFLECAWHALEAAGYAADTSKGLIGLYAGSSRNFPWEALTFLSGRAGIIGEFSWGLLTDKDYLCTIVSYNLGLTGPSVFVKSACSTSLAAVHLACQAILSGECDTALAGGISIINRQKTGYVYQEGMINSADGHCRVFDRDAKGTVGGEGVGIVVLKRLEEALEHRDYIHATIKGTAINNDGTRKIGYTAPSIQGQADVVREALHVADVEPESITYVETHGTGTPVGDPIEIEALKTAFKTEKKGFCSIGSVKSNIGHLDAAAGIAGLIKTILALKHRLIPPSLHYQVPNAKIDFENSPFYVNTRLTPWKSDNHPFRAGVSSFGIGGTNVHVVLEAWPSTHSADHSANNLEHMEQGTLSQGRGGVSPPSSSRNHQLILLSAKTAAALEKQTENLSEYLKKNPGICLADEAYTLQVGRSAFNHRRMLVCSTVDEASEAFSAADSRKVRTGLAREEKRFVVFMFPGLGAQYVNMARELYDTESIFRDEMNRCFEILNALLEYDIKEILYPTSLHNRSDGSYITQPEIAQLLIFILEYALAKLLINWGITPDALIGYSFGEYTAACISGVFSLEDALSLVVSRGKLLQKTPEGAMLSVPLPKEKLLPWLDGSDLSLAVDNGPSCIVSGTAAEIRTFENRMKQNRYVCVPLPHASRALHSPMMKPMLKELEDIVGTLDIKKPGIPYISNVTGQWITDREATSPAYWAAHLQSTVQFSRGVKELLKNPGTIFVEVGPGHDLCGLIRHHVNDNTASLVLNLVNHAQTGTSDARYLLTGLGRLWLSGINIDWPQFYRKEKRHRVPLPLYPFEGKRYWIEGDPVKMSIDARDTRGLQADKKPDAADWFYIPTWKRSILPWHQEKRIVEKACWLVFSDETGLAEGLSKRLAQEGHHVIRVCQGEVFARVEDREGIPIEKDIHTYNIDHRQQHDYDTLFAELKQLDKIPGKIVHFWGVTQDSPEETELETVLDSGFFSLFYLARAAGKHCTREQLQMLVVSNHLHRVTSQEKLCPAKAAVLGAVKVIPKEYPSITCRSIDIELPTQDSENMQLLVNQILMEYSAEFSEPVAAYRGDYRWVQVFEPLRLEKTNEKNLRLKEKGVYLITGGLGGIGLVLAEHLAASVQAKLVLTGRSDFPDGENWQQWLDNHGEEDSVSQKIKKIQHLEELGAEVVVCSADAADLTQMQAVIHLAKERFAGINGVIHAAGLPDGGMIPLRTRDSIEPILAPKVKGTLVLDQVLKDETLDFFVLCSSVSAILGLLGQVGYCAANAFQDAFAYYKTHRDGTFTLSINWDFWQEVGMGVETVKQLKQNKNIADADLLLQRGILSSEGTEIFDRVLPGGYPQVIVSTWDLFDRFRAISSPAAAGTEESIGIESFSGSLHPRPELTTEYEAPETGFEKTFADILQKYFGFEQVGIHDNLFEFGITSLDMIHINNALKKKIETDIPIVVMFEYPTIYSLEQYLEQDGDRGVEDLDKVENLLHDSIDILRDGL